MDPSQWQFSGNPERLAELEIAITNLTRLLGLTDNPNTAAVLVTERRAMREEFEELCRRAR